MSIVLSNNRKFLIASRLFSDLGAYSSLAVFPAYIFLFTSNPIYLSIFFLCRILGGLIAGFTANYILRSHTKYVLIISDLLRAFTILVFVILVNSSHNIILALLLPAFVLGFGQSLYNIGVNSNVPNLVASHHISTTNIILSVTSSVAIVISGLIMSFGLALANYNIAFLTIIALYIASTILIGMVNFTEVKAKLPPKQKLLKSITLLKQEYFVIVMMIITFVDTLASGSHNIGRPILASEINYSRLGVYTALLLTIWATGKMIGAISAKRYVLDINNNRLIAYFIGGVLLMSSSFIIAYNIKVTALILVFLLLAGFGDGLSEVTFITRLQRLQDTLRIISFSWASIAQTVGFSIGLVITGLVLQFISLGSTVFLFHMISVVFCVFTLMLYGYYQYKKIKCKPNNKDNLL